MSVLMASYDTTARLVKCHYKKSSQKFTGHVNMVYATLLSSYSDSMLTASLDWTAYLWSIAAEKCLQTFSKRGVEHSGFRNSTVFPQSSPRMAVPF